MMYIISAPQSYKGETATHPYHILPKYPKIAWDLHTKMCLKNCTRHLREALRQKKCVAYLLDQIFIRPFEKRSFYFMPFSVRPSVRLSVRSTVCKPFSFPDNSSYTFLSDDAKTLWIVSLGCGAAHFVSGYQSVWLCRSYCLWRLKTWTWFPDNSSYITYPVKLEVSE